MSDILTFVNLLNIIIALFLTLVAFNTYTSYRLRIFKIPWLIILFGSVLWLLGHILMFFGLRGLVHYTLFTLFILLLTVALYLLARTGKTLGGV